MELESRIYIAGHNGMVGSAIVRNLRERGYNNLILINRNQLDLLDQENVKVFFKKNKPEYVFICASRVGGIHANNTYRAEFIYENLEMQNNLIHFSYMNGVKKLFFLGSSCIYPRDSKQPMKEEYLLKGPLEKTNEPYGIAKIAGIKMCENYYRQYGANYISVMPTNLYGPHDNFDLNTSHVLPALINKFHDAKIKNSNYVEVWGSGNPKREFLYVDDCADACVHLMNSLDAKSLFSQKITHINIGSGKEISIKDLAILITEIIDYKGQIKFNIEKPDGSKHKLLDISRLSNLGFKAKIDLKTGIKKTYNWYIQNHL